MKPALRLSLDNKLNLTSQLSQAIQLLPLSAIELQAKISAMLESNPMLELQDNHLAEEELPGIAYFNLGMNTPSASSSAPLINRPASLQDYLFWQLQLTPFSEKDRLIATALIHAINDEGFLDCALEEIASTLTPDMRVNLAEVEAVLHRIQRFDPIASGSRDMSECLKIQIEDLPEDCSWKEKAAEMVTHYLPLLGKHDYASLQRRLNLNLEQLREVIHGIKSLNPRPQTGIYQQPLDTRLPDVYTYKKADKWSVELNPVCTAPLIINPTYAAFVKNRNKQADNQHLKAQLLEAHWFLKSIERRNQTLLRVSEYIVNAQQNFLAKGDKAMRPLNGKEIAKALNLHPSTISRITTNKYLATPRGTFSLKHFLSQPTASTEGKTSSPIAIGALIKKLISAENPFKPLSDNKLTGLLQTRGISLARRTVAKYRDLLMIPPAGQRKPLI